MKKEQKLNAGMQALLEGRQNAGTEPPSDEASIIEEEVTSEQEQEATPEEEQELLDSIEDKELREALEAKRNIKRGRPRKGVEVRNRQEEMYTRFCTLIRRDQLAKIKEICYRETLTLKETLEYIFGEAIAAYERREGEVRPQTHRGDAASVFGESRTARRK